MANILDDATVVTRSPFADITRSRDGQRLMEQHAAGNLDTLSIDFEGDSDDAHQFTKSLRKVMNNHGYTLKTKIDAQNKKLLLWAIKSGYRSFPIKTQPNPRTVELENQPGFQQPKR